ncbi:DUF3265 domain-containing protein [Vibrio crassostreae]|nr:DUF3265 domain-containing protein [Vibrio crassostreae]
MVITINLRLIRNAWYFNDALRLLFETAC